MINSSNGFYTSVLAGFVLQAKNILWKRERIWQKYQERERVGGTGEEKGDSTPTHNLGKLRSAPTLPRPGCQAATKPLRSKTSADKALKQDSARKNSYTHVTSLPVCPRQCGPRGHLPLSEMSQCAHHITWSSHYTPSTSKTEKYMQLVIKWQANAVL